MEKILYILLLLFVLSGCFWSKGDKSEEIVTDGTVSQDVQQEEKNPIVDAYEGIIVDTSQDTLSKTRGDISINDLDLLAAGEELKKDNPLLKVGKKFQENIVKKSMGNISRRVLGGTVYEDYEKEISKMSEKILTDMTLNLTIKDYKTGELIDSGVVYVNNILMGSFEKGQMIKKFKWPQGTEKFHIVVRTEKYGDGFLSLNAVYSNGGLLQGVVKLKKAMILKNIDLSKETEIKTPKVKAEFEKCSLVDSSGKCAEEKVNVKVNFISGTQANSNTSSVNMKAMTKKGDIVQLTSGGMAFIDFENRQGEYLKLADGKSMKIVYNVTQEDIDRMKSTEGMNDKQGYWWYDKNIGLWKETDSKWTLDKKNKTWTAIITDLY